MRRKVIAWGEVGRIFSAEAIAFIGSAIAFLEVPTQNYKEAKPEEKSTHEIRVQEWSRIIQTCNTRGIPKKQWCGENGVSVQKFFYWQKRIRAEVKCTRK